MNGNDQRHLDEFKKAGVKIGNTYYVRVADWQTGSGKHTRSRAYPASVWRVERGQGHEEYFNSNTRVRTALIYQEVE